jgi:hypothetical protein
MRYYGVMPLDGIPARPQRPTVDVEALRVPDQVRVVGDRLVWAFERVPRQGPVDIPRDLLEQFLALRWPEDSPQIPEGRRVTWRTLVRPAFLGASPRYPTAIVARYAELSSDDVCEFATRHGVFAICEHALPTTHSITAGTPGWALRQAYPQVTDCLPLGAVDETFQEQMGFPSHEGGARGLAGWEPVSYWRDAASLFYSVLSAAYWYARGEQPDAVAIGDLSSWPSRDFLPEDPTERAEILTGVRRAIPHYGPPSLQEELRRRGGMVWPYAISPKPDWDWETIRSLYVERYSMEPVEPEPEFDAVLRPMATWSTSLGTGRLMLDRYVNGLLALARPHLVFRSARRRRALLAADGLFGALVLQLLLRLHGSVGFAVCSGCGQFFAPLRRPARNTPAYCPECRKTKANAARQQRWRENHRRASATPPAAAAP